MDIVKTFLFAALVCARPVTLNAQFINPEEPFAHTFSILAYDSVTKEIGVAVQSHWFAVGKTVAWGEAGIGVVVTQAVSNISFGPKGLELLRQGLSPQQVVDSLIKSDPAREMRQLAVMNKEGISAAYSGKYCLPSAGHIAGDNFSIQANTGYSDQIWSKMAVAFKQSNGALGDRMIAALKAGQSEGGDIRGKQSACMLIVAPTSSNRVWIDRKVDLQVADHKEPISELERLFHVQKAYDSLNKANYLFARGQHDEAHELYLKAQSMYPENRELTFWYTVELLNKNNVEKAIPILEETFKKAPEWRDVIVPRLYKIGMLMISKETYDKLLTLGK